MKILALVFALISSGAIASDVGAPNRQEANANLALATQETGASTSWALEPNDKESNHQIQKLNRHIDEINSHIRRDLNAVMAEKIEQMIQQQSTITAGR